MVSGEISLTNDAWQASNTDGYFAVTGHWIEERAPGKWKLEHALFGFTIMNTAHNGIRLGQALYKICDRLKIVHKVCHLHSRSLSSTASSWPYYRSVTLRAMLQVTITRCLMNLHAATGGR